ncbi:retrotransposable element Tf2 [Tanacetum coccineum]
MFVRNCNVCQIFKPELVPNPGLLQPLPIPNQIWSKILMDSVEPMSKGKSVIMVVADRLSKMGHFIPLSHPYTAFIFAQAFLDNIYKLHDLPKIIVSDKDTVFLKELFHKLQVSLHMSLTYHPQTDGQIEVVNRSMECYLRCMCRDKPKEWANWIALAEYWYNNSYQNNINNHT